MPAIPYKPALYEKTHALGTVFYEIQQFCKCAMRLHSNPRLDQHLKNAVLESMLLHVRVLQDFFERGSRTQRNHQELDDVLCSDFGFPTNDLGLSDGIRNRVNREVAYLSYGRALRVSTEDKNWEFAGFLPLILRCIEFVVSRSKDELQQLQEYRARNVMVPISWDGLGQDLTELKEKLQAS